VWDGYRGYVFQNVLDALEMEGATLTRVASVPETVWENRPELHFHRFSAVGYLYPFIEDIHPVMREEGAADIFRVERPQARRSGLAPLADPGGGG
jgi:hypothetical protein